MDAHWSNGSSNKKNKASIEIVAEKFMFLKSMYIHLCLLYSGRQNEGQNIQVVDAHWLKKSLYKNQATIWNNSREILLN